MRWRAGKSIGCPGRISCSLPKAIRLPLKEIAPMAMPNAPEIAAPSPARSPWPLARRNSAIETSAAVAPPMPLKSATICGIAVIWTRLAL